jgi:two-component system LytT family response regulator
MIKALIVDKEQKSRESLEKMINRHLKKKIKILDKVNNLNLAVDSVNKNKPDLLFLDVSFKDRTGLELLHHFNTFKPFEVIFVSEDQNYAIDAVKNSAVDYLLKPINMVDLVTAFKRFEHKKALLNSNPSRNIEEPSNVDDKFNKRQTIAFPYKNGFKVEHVSSILYCEANRNKTNLYTYTNNKLEIFKSLKTITKMIDHSDFFRVHKSYYINMNHILSYNTSEHLVELSNGSFVPVSIRNSDAFKKKLTSKI